MEDTKIIDLYFARSETAIDETAKKYGSYLSAIANNILHRHEDTEEVVNDVYLATWNSLPPNRPRILKHYLARITRNLSFDRFDYLSAEKRSSCAEVMLSELEECIPDNQRDPAEAVEAKELDKAIDRFLSGLSKEDCGLFVSRYFYVQTIDALAKKYNSTPRKIKYRLEKLRRQLNLQLKKEGIV